jgi:hypothetical protein
VENKKPYERPSLRKVRLEVKASVLGVCSQSPANIVKVGTTGCTVTHCYTT